MLSRQRLRRQGVQPRGAEMPARERVHQRRLIDQSAAWAARNASTSASIACVSIRRASSRNTASNGSSVTPDPGLSAGYNGVPRHGVSSR